MKKTNLFIDGKLSSATSQEDFPNYNPATGEVISLVDQASQADLDRAVESSKRGFAVWASMTAQERSRILLNAVAILRERNDELAKL